MIEINWKIFEVKHPKTTVAFENLCYFLFCRKYNLAEGIRTDFNQVGLETEPIKDSKGKYCGFQAKFFEKNINYTNIRESIDKALKKHKQLDHIIIYINQQAQTSCESAKQIEDKCSDKGVTVEWFLPNNFKIVLNQPSNLDLAEFYFAEKNTLKILSNIKSVRMNTLIQSKEYVKLNLRNENNILSIENCSDMILKSQEKLYLLTGNAGTGKSVCMWKLFNIYGGYEAKSESKQLEVIGKVGAICRFINLNNTSLDFIEQNIITNSTNKNFIFLLDGLDEISSKSITSTLLFIESLLEKETTKKIIISSRLSNYNKYILKATFPNLLEYTIEDLNKDQIQKYFDDKKDTERKCKFDELVEKNNQFLEDITDILTLTLLWKHIYDIKPQNYFVDLMKISVETILNDVHHKKYLEELNLPNPKNKAILQINKELALYLFENEKFSFSQSELQKIIRKVYPNNDYTSVNNIVSYMADSFFDVIVTENTQTFSYQHRRFAEYFSLMSFENKMQKDLSYFRKNNIIINYDLFEKMLLPYLQSRAMQRKNIPLTFEIGLFNVYLGNDISWGINKKFYFWSRQIIYAIAALSENNLQSVAEDKALPIYKYFHEVPKEIIELLSHNEKIQFNDEFNQNYINYLLLTVLLHRYGKSELLRKILPYYEKIDAICREKNYWFNNASNRDTYLVWRCLLYINIVIYENKHNNNMEEIIQTSSKLNIDKLFMEHISSNILYLSSLYYNLLLHSPEKCVDIVEKMNLNQLSIFAHAVSNPECLNKIVKNKNLKKALLKVLENEISGQGLSVAMCLVLKSIVGCNLTESEIRIIRDYLNTSNFKSYSVFWAGHCDVVGFLLIPFEKQVHQENIDPDVNEYAIAYKNYFRLLNDQSTISKFVSSIKNSLNEKAEKTYYIRRLLGKTLALLDTDENLIRGAIDYICGIMKENGILIVLHTMKLFNPERFNKLISSSIINKLNIPHVYQDIDYISTSDLLFMLSFITSSHNKLQGYKILLKGLSNGIMRMNDRKDTIGDYKLLESLEVILKNNWITTDKLIAYLDRILLIADKMNTYHIENDVYGEAMKILQKYDFEAAKYYYNQISRKSGSYNFLHYDFAKGLILRGENVENIEKCLSNITLTFDEFHQKLCWDGFYYKLSIYLGIAICDYYSTYLQDKYFLKACEEIDKLETAGWNRELKEEEYVMYSKLCRDKNKKMDVNKEKEILHSPVLQKKKENALQALTEIDSRESLKIFVSKLHSNYILDSYEVNELLIEKSIKLIGNIDDIIGVLAKSHYPSNTSYSINSPYFWMTIVCALRNEKAKSSIVDYLITYGGGHDGFSELLKIYGYLGNRDVCLEAFDKMMDCIEFLLC